MRIVVACASLTYRTLVDTPGAQAILGYNVNTKNRATDNPVGPGA